MDVYRCGRLAGRIAGDSLSATDVNRTDVLIVGAGAAGLTAARALSDAGLQTLVVDRGRSPGGRMSTRQFQGGRADQGAQFFTVRSNTFRAVVDGWLAAGLVYEWSRGWSGGSALGGELDGHPRYAARGGFGALAERLAIGLDVRLGTRLTTIGRGSDGWLAICEQGERYNARGIVLTPPVPQSLALLGDAIALAAVERVQLRAIEYAPCLCGLFVVDGGTRLPEPGALQRPDHPVSWIADNRHKGVSPDACVVTVHVGPAASRQHWSDEDAVVLGWLTEELRPFLLSGSRLREAHLKRWRYAVPEHVIAARCLAGAEQSLVFAGDAFGGPRVEGAVLSGRAAAAALGEHL